MVPLHERARPSLKGLDHQPQPVHGSAEAWNRLKQLVSLARSLNPSLPRFLRFMKTADAYHMAEASFLPVLTDSTEPDLRWPSAHPEENIESSPRIMPLTEAFQEAMLPEALWRAEMTAIRNSYSVGIHDGIDAAVLMAHRNALINFHTARDPVDDSFFVDQEPSDDRFLSTSPFVVPDLVCLSHPDFARLVLHATAEHAAHPRLRETVRFVTDRLTRPMSATSPDEIDATLQALHELNGRPNSPPFEQRYQHGWIALALAHEGSDWVPPLLSQGCSPTQPYSQVDPLSLAIMRNDGSAVEALLQSGVSVGTLYDGVPAGLDEIGQRHLKGVAHELLSPLSFACLMDADAAAEALLRHGANPNQPTDLGRFPLVFAALSGNRTIATLLMAYGADMTMETPEGCLPEELVPEPILDSDATTLTALIDDLSSVRLGERPRPTVPPTSYPPREKLAERLIAHEQRRLGARAAQAQPMTPGAAQPLPDQPLGRRPMSIK